ncbi:MAG: ATP-binding cassette domain-containing protein [Eggerthellaceae bacterium]|jgi:energy-coupling factor transporter ATP-binding protein EcfA2
MIAFEGVSFAYRDDRREANTARKQGKRRRERGRREEADVNVPAERAAVRDVSFSLERTGLLGIAGATGSGKSTLLKLLAGLLEPQSGRIVRTSDGDGARPLRVGLVFQYPERQLFAQTVRADAAFGPHNRGLDREQAERDAEWALRMAGVPEALWDRNPFSLSGGEQRRVALAGVLALRPDVLALDEPTAGQDPAHRRDLAALLEQLRERGMPIVMTSHDMNLLMRCDQVLIMDQGSIVAHGTPAQTLSDTEQLASCGLEAPEMLRMASCLRQNGFDIPTDADTAEALADALARTLHHPL